MGVTTKEIDHGYRAALRQIDFVKRNKPFVKIGIQSDAGNHPSSKAGDIVTVVSIATFNEFGTSKIPERSFIRSTMDEEKAGLIRKTRALFFQMASGRMTTKRALSILGQLITAKIKRKITVLKKPPNAPITIKRKGSSNPLIDTGFMRQKIRDELVLSGRDNV